GPTPKRSQPWNPEGSRGCKASAAAPNLASLHGTLPQVKAQESDDQWISDKVLTGRIDLQRRRNWYSVSGSLPDKPSSGRFSILLQQVKELEPCIADLHQQLARRPLLACSNVPE